MVDMQTQTATAPTTAAATNSALIDRIWPAAIIIFGLGLTVAWAALLGYGLVSIINLAF
jgi:hypothetical protein